MTTSSDESANLSDDAPIIQLLRTDTAKLSTEELNERIAAFKHLEASASAARAAMIVGSTAARPSSTKRSVKPNLTLDDLFIDLDTPGPGDSVPGA
jgi:hypothetical protein